MNKPIRLSTWRVGTRVQVTDPEGIEPPLTATVIEIEGGLAGFVVRWDHNGEVGWQSVEDIHLFTPAE